MNMNMNISRSNHLTSSEVYEILKPLGYRWSNEAQCYYSTDFELSLLTDKEGYNLAQRIQRTYQSRGTI